MSSSKSLAQLSPRYGERRVLLAGGASFIGSHLAELLLEAGARIRIADDLSSGSLENISGFAKQIEFVQGDLRDPSFSRVVSQEQEILFHLAASHGGRGYIDTHPVECAGNMALDHTVFAAAVDSGVRQLVFASSACVYPVTLQASESARALLKESDANFEEPGKAYADGEYGWAKLMGELQLRAFHRQHGIDAVACRIFTAYGERENESHAVIALIAKALARRDPFPVWGTGRQTRNFTYVKDTVMGMALAGARLRGFSVINVGSSRHHTVLEAIEEIFACVGWRPSEIRPELDRPVGVLSRASDNAQSRALLGWEPSVSLAEGIGRTVSWYRTIASPERLDRLDDLLFERSVSR